MIIAKRPRRYARKTEKCDMAGAKLTTHSRTPGERERNKKRARHFSARVRGVKRASRFRNCARAEKVGPKPAKKLQE